MMGLEFLILSGLIQVGTALFQDVMQSHENKKARNEAREIAMQNRTDTLNQRRVNNKLAERGNSLNNRSLAFESKMVNEGIKDAEKERERLTKQRDGDFITQSVNKLTQDTEEDFLGLNKRSIGRLF